LIGLTAYPVTVANLNRIGIARMSRADDLVSFVSPRLSPIRVARAGLSPSDVDHARAFKKNGG